MCLFSQRKPKTENRKLKTQNPKSERYAGPGSLACWFCLLLAAVLYAAVALSPKLVALTLLRHEHEQNQERLVALEKQVERIERISEALEHDPEFNAALARADFEQVRPGEQRITVQPHLALELRPSAANLKLPDLPLPWYVPLLEVFSENRRLSNIVLGLAAALALLSFLAVRGMPVNGVPDLPDSSPGWLFSLLQERYRKHEKRA